MAYIPPHKRVSNTQKARPPKSAQMIPHFKNSLHLNSSRCRIDLRITQTASHGDRLICAYPSVLRWLAVPPLPDDVQLHSSLRLVPVCLDYMEKKTGEKLLILINGHSQQENHNLERTWASVAETVHADLLPAFEDIRNELMVDQSLEETKPKIVAQFGKIIFRWDPTFNRDFDGEKSVSEFYMKGLRRMFYTNVGKEYMEHIKIMFMSELGVQFEEEKEVYHVKLRDAKQPDSTVTCKCRVLQDENKLEHYKIESNPVRHRVADISCLDGNVDLRLSLCTKGILMALEDAELQNIRDLISSAIIDSNVKGGLRWPLEKKANLGGQYSVVGVWHTKTEAYNISSNIRLIVRLSDSFGSLTSTGEVTREVALRLRGITRNLLANEAGGVMAMLEDALFLIRNHFLAWDGSLVSCSES